MLRNYLKVALRNLRKHKLYSAINVAGLAIGIAGSLLILLLVRHELAYDGFHDKGGRTYRVVMDWIYADGKVTRPAVTAGRLAPTLDEHYPIVERAVRLHPTYQAHFFQRGDAGFYEERGYYAEADVFEVLTLPLEAGDPRTALAEPYSLVLSQELARKYFGAAEPLGQTLVVQDTMHCRVTGVLAPLAGPTHLELDFLISLATLESAGWIGLRPDIAENWGNLGWHTYVLLREGVPREAAARQIGAVTEVHGADWMERHGSRFVHHLQLLDEIYLHSAHLFFDRGPRGDAARTYAFAAIAGLVLLIACFNFVNLATARAQDRAREIGMRKAVGAYRRQLVGQLLGESLLISGLALALALALADLALPWFNGLTGLELELALDPAAALALVGVGVLVGLLAGAYPALALSRFRPAEVLKARGRGGRQSARLRQGLVVFQFFASVALIVCALVVGAQLDHMRGRHPGFDKEQVVVIDFRRNPDIQSRHEAVRDELVKLPEVVDAAASGTVPGRFYNNANIPVPGSAEETRVEFFIQTIDHNFVETLGLRVVAGRNFSKAHPSDGEGILLNETALDFLGWTAAEALGKAFDWFGDRSLRVIGVVADFHHAGLQDPIEPYILLHQPDRFSCFSVKIAPGQTQAALAALQETWARLAPGRPFEYFFLDEDFDRHYRGEERLGRAFAACAALAVLVACLGLFGLVSFMAQKRTKEIGIRKAVGASVRDIVALLTGDFARLVAVGAVGAWPVAYWGLQRWLAGYAYRVELGPAEFLLAAAAALAIALLTVGYQALRAARANPVAALRYE